jgi:hypothetical protein
LHTGDDRFSSPATDRHPLSRSGIAVVKHLSIQEAADWVASQGWVSLRNPRSLRFEFVDPEGLTRYEATISADSATVGCDMAELFLHDVPRAKFPGALFWIARPVYASPAKWMLVEQVLRAADLNIPPESAYFVLLDEAEYVSCIALVALTLMFGWDANLVLTGRRFLLEIDDEPFPALVTDIVSEWFAQASKNLEFKVSRLAASAAG